MLRSESEEELFQQMASATGVVFKKAKTPEPTSPVPGLSDQQVKSAIAMADNAISTAKGLVADGTEEVKTHLSHIGTLAHAGTEEAKKRLNTIGALAYSSKMGPVPERGPGTVTGTVASSENISTASKATSISSSSRRNLDLKHNDNAFHVVANLVIDRFQSQIPPGATSYTLSEEDVAHLDQMVPASVRTSFVEAIRYRLVHNCPEDSTSQVHVLTRQAKMYGLDKEDDTNPLIASLSPTNQVITITVSLLVSRSFGGRDAGLILRFACRIFHPQAPSWMALPVNPAVLRDRRVLENQSTPLDPLAYPGLHPGSLGTLCAQHCLPCIRVL